MCVQYFILYIVGHDGLCDQYGFGELARLIMSCYSRIENWLKSNQSPQLVIWT